MFGIPFLHNFKPSGLVPYDLNQFGGIPIVRAAAVSMGGILYCSTGTNSAQNVTGSNGTFSRKQAFAYNIATGEVTGWNPGGVGGGFTGTGNPFMGALAVGSDGFVYCSLNISIPPAGTGQVQGVAFPGICRFDPITGAADATWIFTSPIPINSNQWANPGPNNICCDGLGKVIWGANQFDPTSGYSPTLYVILESTATIVRAHLAGNQVRTVTADSSGNYYAGGPFLTIDATTRRKLAKYSSLGVLQSSPNPAASPLTEINAIAYIGSLLYVGGYDGSISCLIAWDLSGNARSTTFNPSVYEVALGNGFGVTGINTATINGVDVVYVTGGFMYIGNALRCLFGVVRASDGLLLNTPYDGSLQNLLNMQSGVMSTYQPLAKSFYNASALTPGIRYDIADTTAYPVSTAFSYFQLGIGPACYKTITIGTIMYCFGSFTGVTVAVGGFGGGTSKTATADFPTGMVAFDLTTGHIYTPFGSGLVGVDAGKGIFGAALSNDGLRFYIAGNFTTVNGVARKGIAAVLVADGSLDSWAPDPSNGSVTPAYNNLEEHSGLIFVSRSNVETAQTVLKFSVYVDANPPTFQVTQNTSNVAQAPRFAVDGNGKYYVCGNFSQANGNARISAARYNANDTFDTTFNMAVSGGAGVVNDMLVDGNLVYFVGEFTSFGGSGRKSVGVWNWSSDTLDSYNIQGNSTYTIYTLIKTGSEFVMSSGNTFAQLNDGVGNFTYNRQGLASFSATGYVNKTKFSGVYFLNGNASRLEAIAAMQSIVYCGVASMAGAGNGYMRIFADT